jgi:hypothetical protein
MPFALTAAFPKRGLRGSQGLKPVSRLRGTAPIFDLPMIGFEQSNGIGRVWRLIIPVSHGMRSLAPAL